MIANQQEPAEDMRRAAATVADRSSTRPADADRAIATILMGAWSEYVALYGTEPHGTFTQLHSMLALQRAGEKIAALFASATRTLPDEEVKK